MSNTITDQIGETTVDASLQRAHRAQKEDGAHIAQTNRLTDLRVFERDVVLPAAPHGGQPSKASPAPDQGPKLPAPSTEWDAFQGGDGQQEGLISIIGAVLALQAKTNSNFWSTQWKQASASMMMEVNFAPIVGAAITAQYNAQSENTQTQADQASTTGAVNIAMFSISMVMAGIQEYKDPSEQLPTDKPKTFEVEPEQAEPEEGSGTGDLENAGEDTELKKMNAEIDDTKKVIDDETDAFKADAKRTFAKGQQMMKRGMTYLTSYLGRAGQAAQMMSMLSQGVTGLTDAKYLSTQALKIAAEGQAATLSKEAEMYSRFYGEDFSREEDLRQGASQNIDNAMNILQQAANTITATVKSMFGG